MNRIIEKAEEYFLDLVARIDEGDEKALTELKNLKKYVAQISALLELVDEDDTVDSIKEKFDILEKRFESLIMELNKVVG